MGVRVRGGEKVPNGASSIWGPLNGGFSPEKATADGRLAGHPCGKALYY